MIVRMAESILTELNDIEDQIKYIEELARVYNVPFDGELYIKHLIKCKLLADY